MRNRSSGANTWRRRAIAFACHSAPGGRPFAGNYVLNTPIGKIRTPNLTPDDETGLGKWTADDFYRALHEGIDNEGSYLYPAFPFAWYTKVTRNDSDAIFAYLRSLEPVKEPRKPSEIPFPLQYSQRAHHLAHRVLHRGRVQAGSKRQRRGQSRRLPRGGPRPLRHVPQRQQDRRKQRVGGQTRWRGHRRLVRAQHHPRRSHRGSALGPTIRWSNTSKPARLRATGRASPPGRCVRPSRNPSPG